MPRGPADRPIRAADDEVALQAAMRRALEQAAAAVQGRSPAPEPPAFGTSVAETAAVRGGSGVVRSRGARAAGLSRRSRKKDAAPPQRAVDPRGRGAKVDVVG